jgi:endo-1,4-beta-xylanase
MRKPTRRECLTMMLAGTAAGCAPAGFFGGEDAPSLDAVARRRGLRFGNALGTGPTGFSRSTADGRPPAFADPQMRVLMAAQCGILVPENELKWYVLRPDRNTFSFARADRLIEYAETNRMAVRGHTLLWNKSEWTPDWVNNYDFGVQPALEAEKMLREHIATVCGRYGKRIFSYDVVNETFFKDTDQFADSVFTKHLGPQVIDVAFHAAREAAPHAQLVYNDYMSWEPEKAQHCIGVLKLLERLKRNNVPVDALGIQCHVGGGSDFDGTAAFSERRQTEWLHFLDAVTDMGLDLIITELDVNDKAVTGDFAARDRAVADLARAFLEPTLSKPQLRYVMAWGMVDKYSWLQGTSPRPDGLPKRPCPYDDDFRSKPLHRALLDVLRGAPNRPAMTYA